MDLLERQFGFYLLAMSGMNESKYVLNYAGEFLISSNQGCLERRYLLFISGL
jgi:hypothetical protein